MGDLIHVAADFIEFRNRFSELFQLHRRAALRTRAFVA